LYGPSFGSYEALFVINHPNWGSFVGEFKLYHMKAKKIQQLLAGLRSSGSSWVVVPCYRIPCRCYGGPSSVSVHWVILKLLVARPWARNLGYSTPDGAIPTGHGEFGF